MITNAIVTAPTIPMPMGMTGESLLPQILATDAIKNDEPTMTPVHFTVRIPATSVAS